MSFKITCAFEGIKHLEKQLESASKSLGKSNIEGILLKSAQKIADSARSKAPRGPTGNLKRSLHAKVLKKKSGYPAIAIAAVDRKIAPHGRLVEFGTVKMPARPFFRPAVDENRSAIFKDLKCEFKDKVEGAAR